MTRTELYSAIVELLGKPVPQWIWDYARDRQDRDDKRIDFYTQYYDTEEKEDAARDFIEKYEAELDFEEVRSRYDRGGESTVRPLGLYRSVPANTNRDVAMAKYIDGHVPRVDVARARAVAAACALDATSRREVSQFRLKYLDGSLIPHSDFDEFMELPSIRVISLARFRNIGLRIGDRCDRIPAECVTTRDHIRVTVRFRETGVSLSEDYSPGAELPTSYETRQVDYGLPNDILPHSVMADILRTARFGSDYGWEVDASIRFLLTGWYPVVPPVQVAAICPYASRGPFAHRRSQWLRIDAAPYVRAETVVDIYRHQQATINMEPLRKARARTYPLSERRLAIVEFLLHEERRKLELRQPPLSDSPASVWRGLRDAFNAEFGHRYDGVRSKKGGVETWAYKDAWRFKDDYYDGLERLGVIIPSAGNTETESRDGNGNDPWDTWGYSVDPDYTGSTEREEGGARQD